MTVRELRDRLAREPDDAAVEVYREGEPDGPAVLAVVDMDSYGYGPSGHGAIALVIAEPDA